jgi:hypothetical protein
MGMAKHINPSPAVAMASTKINTVQLIPALADSLRREHNLAPCGNTYHGNLGVFLRNVDDDYRSNIQIYDRSNHRIQGSKFGETSCIWGFV